MPAQELFQANPPPDPSLLPESLNSLSVKLDLDALTPAELSDVRKFRRAADYIAAGASIHAFVSVFFVVLTRFSTL